MIDDLEQASSLASSINCNPYLVSGCEGNVFKLSKGGCCFNRRYLIVKEGTISYYRDPPHSLNLVSIKTQVSTDPKGQISARLCKFQQIDSNIFTKKTHSFLFEISFLSPSRKGKRIFWVFATHSQILCDNWLKALEIEKNFDCSKTENAMKAQKALENKIIDEMNKRKMREEAFKKMNELEKRKQRLKEQMIEEQKRKNEVENERKRLQDEQEKKKLEEIEAQKRKRYEKLLKFSWDYQFQVLWGQTVRSETYEQSMISGIRFFKHLGSFKRKVTEVSRLIINELTLPDHERQFFPLEESESYQIYQYQNICFKLTPRNSRTPDWQLFGHEFRANNWLFDNLYTLAKSIPTLPFRLPPMCLVDFRGFRILAVAMTPLEGDRSLVHGPKSDGVFLVEQNFYSWLKELALKTRLKEHFFEWNSRVGPCYVHLSAFLEFHRTFGYAELENFVNENIGMDEKVRTEENVYMTQAGYLLPVDLENSGIVDFSKRLRPEFLSIYPERLSSDGFINKHVSSSAENEKLLKAGQFLRTFQIDLLVKDLDSLDLFVIDSRSLTEAFHLKGVNMRYMGKVAEKSRLTHVKQMIFIECLARSCKVLLFQLLSEFNLDYSKVHEQGDLSARTMSYMQSPLIAEDMQKLSRKSIHTVFTPSIKKRLHRKTTTSVAFEDPEGLFEDYLPFNTFTLDSFMYQKVADFFNLVFGNRPESDFFWTRVVIPTATSKYGVDAEKIQKKLINLNALIFSICFHCNISVDFQANLDFTKEKPFNLEMIKMIEAKCNSFEMNNVEYKILANKSGTCLNQKKFALALQACELKMRISVVVDRENELGDFRVLTEIAEVLVETGDIDNATKKAKEALIQIHPFSVTSVRTWCVLVKAFLKKGLQIEALDCFNAALAALNFHYGAFHPLHIKIHVFLGEIYMSLKDFQSADKFLKVALASSLKILGPNHRQTAQIYLALGKVSSFEGDYEKNLEYNEKSYLIFSSEFGNSHLLTLSSELLLAESAEKLGYFDRTLEIARKVCIGFKKATKVGIPEDDSKDILRFSIRSQSIIKNK
jgi:tetratricopeptide (TPR) repeat protein